MCQASPVRTVRGEAFGEANERLAAPAAGDQALGEALRRGVAPDERDEIASLLGCADPLDDGVIATTVEHDGHRAVADAETPHRRDVGDASQRVFEVGVLGTLPAVPADAHGHVRARHRLSRSCSRAAACSSR
jgi:hypothetical protein